MTDSPMKPIGLTKVGGPGFADVLEMPRDTPAQCAAADAAFQRFLKGLPAFRCKGCGVTIRGRRPARKRPRRRVPSGNTSQANHRSVSATWRQEEAAIRAEHCSDCAETAVKEFRRRRRAEMPPRDLLRDAQVPLLHLEPFDHQRACLSDTGEWPRDHRSRFQRISLEAWEGNPHLLTITGPVGAGKTRLGVELLTRILRRSQRTALFVRAGELVQRGFDSAVERRLQAARDRSIVLLDDVGRGLSAMHVGWHTLADLIDDRWADKGTTIITTNMPITVRGAEHLARQKHQLRKNARPDPALVKPSVESSSVAIASRLLGGLVVNLDRPDQRVRARQP